MTSNDTTPISAPGGFALRCADGRRTRVYVSPEAALRAVARGEVFSDADYAAGRFWPTPGNPTPGTPTFSEKAANAKAARVAAYYEAQRARRAA